MRQLSLLEVATAGSLLCSVLAVGVPAFVRNVHASRLNEPLWGLQQLGARATALAAARGVAQAYPVSVALTPDEVPKGVAVEDGPDAWQHPTWLELGFGFEAPHRFSFAFDSKNSPGGSSFVARAHGDLDADGVFSRFELQGEFLPGGQPVIYPLDIQREVE